MIKYSLTSSMFQEFTEQGYNRIPLVRELLTDLDTPLSIYLKLAAGPNSYLLESVQGGEKWGRYSIIGLPCHNRIRVCGQKIIIENHNQAIETIESKDPLLWLENYQKQFKIAPVFGLPRFTGGLVGYFGYDTIRYIEPRLANCLNPDPLNTPEIILLISDEIAVFDTLSGKLFLIKNLDPTKGDTWEIGTARLNQLTEQLNYNHVINLLNKSRHINEADFISEFNKNEFKKAVKSIQDYIQAGDCMQVVLSQRFSIPIQAAPINIYRALRYLNPSPYMYFFDFGEFQIVGSSPEILTRLEDHEITVRPIAGTRPRGQNEIEDQKLEAELLSDPKERAEHLMLIDLGRNDVGKVAIIGSVQVTDQMIIERYSHVMHIVSNVIGTLKNELSPFALLRATFPAGTVSGAPKIRALEIIDELEPVKRGIYSGAVGYLSWNGNLDLAIAIRTAIIKTNILYIQAGAGIVADSIPEQEWQETMNKARALFRAVSAAEAGFN